MKFTIFLLALSASAQTTYPSMYPAASTAQPPTTLHVNVAYPPAAIIKAKYQISALPKGLALAEVTVHNPSDQVITVGQSEVIQAFAAHGLTVWPRADAVAVLGGKQASTKKTQVFKWTEVGLIITASIALSGVVHFTPATMSTLGLSLSIANGSFVTIAQAAGENPLNTYDSDGMQSIISIPAHSGVLGTVLMSGASGVSAFDVVR